jgi:GNAT superfamily N-acetyltransferase
MRERIEAGGVRVAGPVGAPLGFAIVRHDELDQLYVAPEAHGTGLAAALLDDAERLLRDRGVATAWLACAIGNARAARFYEKRGWTRVRTFTHLADTSDGLMPVETWRYEKRVGDARS